MGIFNKKAKDARFDDSYDNDFFRDDEEDGVIGEDDEELSAPAMPPVKKPAANKASNSANSGALKVVKPRDAQDALIIADYLINGYTVVMNIESLEREITMRLVDFLQGALHVLDGELRRVTKSTLVLSPRRGEVSSDDAEAERNGEDY